MYDTQPAAVMVAAGAALVLVMISILIIRLGEGDVLSGWLMLDCAIK